MFGCPGEYVQLILHSYGLRGPLRLKDRSGQVVCPSTDGSGVEFGAGIMLSITISSSHHPIITSHPIITPSHHHAIPSSRHPIITPSHHHAIPSSHHPIITPSHHHAIPSSHHHHHPIITPSHHHTIPSSHHPIITPSHHHTIITPSSHHPITSPSFITFKGLLKLLNVVLRSNMAEENMS